MNYINELEINYCVRMKNNDCPYWNQFYSPNEDEVFKYYENNKNCYDNIYLIKRTINEEVVE